MRLGRGRGAGGGAGLERGVVRGGALRKTDLCPALATSQLVTKAQNKTPHNSSPNLYLTLTVTPTGNGQRRHVRTQRARYLRGVWLLMILHLQSVQRSVLHIALNMDRKPALSDRLAVVTTLFRCDDDILRLNALK